MRVTATLFRSAGALLMCVGMGSSGPQAETPGPQDGRLWIGDQEFRIEPEVLLEFREVSRIVAQEPGARAIERAASRLSRRALAALDHVNRALPRSGSPPYVPVECSALSLELVAAIGRYPESCRLHAIGPSGPGCAVELALLTGDAAELDGCVWWHGRTARRTGDSDGDGAGDALDNCPYDPQKVWEGWCGCGVPDRDEDANGVPDCLDDCGEDCEDSPDDGDCSPIGILIGACHDLS